MYHAIVILVKLIQVTTEFTVIILDGRSLAMILSIQHFEKQLPSDLWVESN